MDTKKTLSTHFNVFDEPWIVEYRESERLTHIGGFLMTYGDMGCVTLSEQIDAPMREIGKVRMLTWLREMRVGTAGVHLWHPDDE